MNTNSTRLLSASLFMFLFVLTAGIAQAQRGNFDPAQMRERQEEANKALIAQLDLSEEQTPLVAGILTAALDERTEMMEEMRGGGGDRGAMRTKMAAIEEATTTKLADVLTKEQLEKYKKILAERPRRGPRPS